MSKEMKMAELLKQADRCLSKIDDLITVSERKVILRIVNDCQRLFDENAALSEALRLKEAECEALAHDKSVLLSFVKRISELGIEDWNYETDDGDLAVEIVGDTKFVSDAVDLIEDIEGADNEKNQQAD